METNKHRLGVQTARKLRSTEHAIDHALAEAFSLGQEMVAGRASAGFAMATGHDALMHLMTGIRHLGEVRSSVVAAHDELLATADAHNIRWHLDGPLETKPMKPGVTTLRSVA